MTFQRIIQLLLVLLVLLALVAHAQQQHAIKRQKVQAQQQLDQRPKQNVKPTRAPGIALNQAAINKKKLQQQDKLKYVTKNLPELGRVRGRIVMSEWSGMHIMEFLDIPYGKSPVGPLRFRPSQPAQPWKGTLRAHKPHPGCPSLQNLDLFLSLNNKNVDLEDCLRLSISSKMLNGTAPVMVYIHGDFLYDGTSMEASPGYLLEEDIVLVSLRYRLGPFGFLSTKSELIPGNAAVHDVILALQWIQQHIAAFGGDAKRVTLFGQVGGAALINILTMSPAVPEGLFQQVIYQSGSALSPAFITDSPLAASRDIARIAGCKNVNKLEPLNKCLRNLNTTELLVAFSIHGDSKALMGIGSYGGVQFVVGGPSGVLPQHPGKLLAAENYRAYPTLGGSVKNGGTFVLKDIYLDNFNETVVDDVFDGMAYIEHVINQTNGADPTSAWKKYAQEDIFSAEDIKNGSFHRMLPGLIDMCSTIAFKNPVLLAMQANAKKLPNSTFLYTFDYAGEKNRYESSILEEFFDTMPFDLGVSMTDENLYLFPWPIFNVLSSNRDIKIAKRMVALWTSFAATGVPKAPGMPEWPPMSEETGPYMKIGQTVAIAESYVDEYNVAVKEARLGYNLVNEYFFESLVEICDEEANEAAEVENDFDGDEGTAKQETFVVIAKKSKRDY